MKKSKYKIGDVRIRYVFYLIPQCIDGKWYWLGHIIEETFTEDGIVELCNYTDEIVGYHDGWNITRVIE